MRISPNPVIISTMEPFASLVLAALDRRGWTQPELADRSGVSQASVSRMVSGKQAPSLDAAAKIARALDLSLDELAGLRASRESLTSAERTLIDFARMAGVDNVVAALVPGVRPTGQGVQPIRPIGASQEKDATPRPAAKHDRERGAG
jgi:transcriptional regulator with XRE-family HTH domain